jgi:Rrf2 family nitric oxide-sensitive transcriptional repressor
MRITKFSDYALRILILLETQPDDRLTTISELANVYSISINHVRVIVHELGKLGYIDSIQGKGGGIKLARKACDISVGDVIRHTEKDFNVVECFNPENATDCSIAKACKLKGVLRNALNAFLETLDQYTLADITANKPSILKQLNLNESSTKDGNKRANH